jgi:hypothetical protein
MLLSPVEAVLAASPIEPISEPEGTVAIAALPSASVHQSDASSELWFRVSLDFVPESGTCPLKPADEAPTNEQAATAQLAPPEVQVPGPVTNLRRADKQ